MIDRNLDDLHPLIEPLCKEFLRHCESDGIRVIIIETWRNPDREDQLHAKGITAATGGTCKHCFTIGGHPASKAFDFSVLDENNRVVQDGTDERYSRCGIIIESIGMIWGGRFHHPDYDHAEIV